MSFWERAWATFVSDPTTVIGIGLLRCRLVFRGFLHKERVQILNDQLSQARRDADTQNLFGPKLSLQNTEIRSHNARRQPKLRRLQIQRLFCWVI